MTPFSRSNTSAKSRPLIRTNGALSTIHNGVDGGGTSEVEAPPAARREAAAATAPTRFRGPRRPRRLALQREAHVEEILHARLGLQRRQPQRHRLLLPRRQVELRHRPRPNDTAVRQDVPPALDQVLRVDLVEPALDRDRAGRQVDGRGVEVAVDVLDGAQPRVRPAVGADQAVLAEVAVVVDAGPIFPVPAVGEEGRPRVAVRRASSAESAGECPGPPSPTRTPPARWCPRRRRPSTPSGRRCCCPSRATYSEMMSGMVGRSPARSTTAAASGRRRS